MCSLDVSLLTLECSKVKAQSAMIQQIMVIYTARGYSINFMVINNVCVIVVVLMTRMSASDFGPGEPHLLVAHVKLRVVDPDEDISQDPERSAHIQSLEATDAHCNAHALLL